MPGTPDTLNQALRGLVHQDVPKPFKRRLEAVMDEDMDRVISILAVTMAGQRNPRLFRSIAIRHLITLGAKAMLDQMTEGGREAA